MKTLEEQWDTPPDVIAYDPWTMIYDPWKL